MPKRSIMLTFIFAAWIVIVAISCSEKRISTYALSGSSDDTMKLWDASTGKEIRTFSGHIGNVNSVSFSPDGRYALSGSDDNTIKLWDVSTGREIR